VNQTISSCNFRVRIFTE